MRRRTSQNRWLRGSWKNESVVKFVHWSSHLNENINIHCDGARNISSCPASSVSCVKCNNNWEWWMFHNVPFPWVTRRLGLVTLVMVFWLYFIVTYYKIIDPHIQHQPNPVYFPISQIIIFGNKARLVSDKTVKLIPFFIKILQHKTEVKKTLLYNFYLLVW